MEDKKQFALKIIPKKLLEKPKAKQKVPILTNSDALGNQAPPRSQTQVHLRPVTRILGRGKCLHAARNMLQWSNRLIYIPEHVRNAQTQEKTHHPRNPVLHLPAHRLTMLPA